MVLRSCVFGCFFFQAEDGIRDLVRSRGLGDVYKRQVQDIDHGLGRQPVRQRRETAQVRQPDRGVHGVGMLSLIHI